MLSAGVGIREALFTLAGQHHGRAGRIFGELAEEAQAGNPLHPALQRRPEVFGTFAPAMVAAAEKTGGLDRNLALVSKTLERFRQIRSKVITALFYPIVLLHLAILIWNVPTLFFLGTNAYLEQVLSILWPIYLGVLLLWFIRELLCDAVWFGELVLSLFIFGGVSRKTGLARFARGLAALYDSGVPLPHALQIAAEMPANPALRASLADAYPSLMGGSGLADALSEIRHVTPMVRNMVATGETSGRLGVSLDKIADFYEDEAGAAIERMAKLIPLSIYLAIVIGIAWNIIAFYMGYFESMPRF
jgi:type IV pilus assembly protein PilC